MVYQHIASLLDKIIVKEQVIVNLKDSFVDWVKRFDDVATAGNDDQQN